MPIIWRELGQTTLICYHKFLDVKLTYMDIFLPQKKGKEALYSHVPFMLSIRIVVSGIRPVSVIWSDRYPGQYRCIMCWYTSTY